MSHGRLYLLHEEQPFTFGGYGKIGFAERGVGIRTAELSKKWAQMLNNPVEGAPTSQARERSLGSDGWPTPKFLREK